MEKQKKKKELTKFIIIIVTIPLFIILIAGIIGFSSGGTNNLFEKKDHWTNYLLSMNIVDAKLTRYRSKELGDAEDFDKTVTINEDDIEEILLNFKESKLTKTWVSGIGGPDKEHLTITYKKKGEKYDFEIYYGSIMVDKLDEELKNLLEKNKYSENDKEKDVPNSFYFYGIDNYNYMIFDKYFK